MGWLLHLSRKGGSCTIASLNYHEKWKQKEWWSKKNERNHVLHLYFGYQQFHRTHMASYELSWRRVKTKINNNFLAILAVAETKPSFHCEAELAWRATAFIQKNTSTFSLRTKSHLTKPQHQAWDHLFSCWSELSKRLPNITCYCYCPWLPPEMVIKAQLVKILYTLKKEPRGSWARTKLKASSLRINFCGTEGAMQASEGRKQLSNSPTQLTMSMNNNNGMVALRVH